MKDASNNPVTTATVTFTAPSTGATGTFGGLATATAVTDSTGVATAPALTANGQAGLYAVTASVAGVSTPANFSLSNMRDQRRMSRQRGAHRRARPSARCSQRLCRQCEGRKQQPGEWGHGHLHCAVYGSHRHFRWIGDGTAVTNSSGIATAPALTANGQAGPYTVTASVAGIATPANFSLTNTAVVPANVTATAGTPQSATISTAFATALQVTVKDAGNNPVNGVIVTFSAPSAGATGTFGGLATATAVSSSTGSLRRRH